MTGLQFRKSKKNESIKIISVIIILLMQISKSSKADINANFQLSKGYGLNYY
jgi:hypothetical protein